MLPLEEDCRFTIKTFIYNIDKSGFKQTILYDVQIPLPDNSQPSDYFGHLIKQHNVPLFVQTEIEHAFADFIFDETNKFTGDFVDKLIKNKLKQCETEPEKLIQATTTTRTFLQTDIGIGNNQQEQHQISSKGNNANNFECQFQYVMRHCSSTQLSLLIREEARMNEEMQSLVKVRNTKIESLERACVSLANSSTNSNNFEIGNNYEKMSMLNVELRKLHVDYAKQIEALLKRQRREYRELVQKLYENHNSIGSFGSPISISSNDKFGTPQSLDVSLTTPISNSKSVDSFQQGKNDAQRNKTKFKKLNSCDGKISLKANAEKKPSNYSECFSFYIGSQLKTMHNARILSCRQLSDLCQSHDVSEFEDQMNLISSKRLHLLMNLYGRELSAALLIVGPDPHWHIKNRTDFARLCEHSTELHFDSLESQLSKIEGFVRTANRERRMKRQMSEQSASNYISQTKFCNGNNLNEDMLQTGDVYITRHSNLSAVQVVFHLVKDTALNDQEINSRHPCISGLHNIVRVAANSAIRNISLPLLLVEEFNEEIMSDGWCSTRAELVYKCWKGFLMEVCSTGGRGGSNSSLVGGAIVPSAGTTQPLHFNINFALPSALPYHLFQQLVELFSSIYYLVPSLNA